MQVILFILNIIKYLYIYKIGEEGTLVVGKILENGDVSYGYDASDSSYGNMIKKGIIDPLKVVRTALMDAASVSSLITTSECVIVDLPKEKEDAMGGSGGPPGGPDYGGMGGMY